MSDNPVPISEWVKQGNEYPTKHVFYNWLRPGKMREELINEGVVTRVNNRWLFNPPRWRTFCANRLRNS